MTVDQTYGWTTSQPAGMGGTIENTGSAPWGMQKIDATVTLRLAAGEPPKVIACDENGYATNRRTETSGTADSCIVRIHETSPYTIVLRQVVPSGHGR